MTTSGRACRTAVAVALLAGIVAIGGGGAPAAGAVGSADDVRLNEIQVVGSHNSYHLAASPEETAVRRQFIGAGDDLLQYEHAPLDVQFAEQKVRQIELDIFRDDAGGKYAEPLLRSVAGNGPYDPAMEEPGTKVLHVQDVDYRSNCLSLVSCLTTVEAWSDANPDHLPIAILLELKADRVPLDGFPFVVPDPWDAAAMDALDDEIRGVVGEDDMITPDDVRGDAATLEDAVLSEGWPTLGASRGQVLFLMDNGGGYRTDYLQGHPSLAGRVMFTNSVPGEADAAFVKVNDSRGNVEEIQQLVADGYLVRTRSDAETVEAREGDTSARDAAFESGAQWVSTDYPVPEYAEPFGTGFVVEIPGGTIARCNPVNGPEGCVSADLEPLDEAGDGPYVDSLYRTFLGRGAGEAEQTYWAGRLDDGLAPAALARGLVRSAEGRRGPITREAFVAYLGRPASAADLDYWSGYIASRPFDHLRVALLASPELLALAGGTPEGFVDAVYQRALGRGADPAGQAYFVDLLAGGTSRSTVARLLVGSPEARARVVQQLVQSLLDRAPTASETAVGSDLLRRTRDPRDVAEQIVATDEYRALVS